MAEKVTFYTTADDGSRIIGSHGVHRATSWRVILPMHKDFMRVGVYDNKPAKRGFDESDIHMIEFLNGKYTTDDESEIRFLRMYNKGGVYFRTEEDERDGKFGVKITPNLFPIIKEQDAYEASRGKQVEVTKIVEKIVTVIPYNVASEYMDETGLLEEAKKHQIDEEGNERYELDKSMKKLELIALLQKHGFVGKA